MGQWEQFHACASNYVAINATVRLLLSEEEYYLDLGLVQAFSLWVTILS
jgi:hypothetical protein